MFYSIILSLLIASIAACGQAPQSGQCQPSEANSCQQSTPDSGGQIDHGPQQKTVVSEYKKVGSQTALALDSSKDLPDCQLANDAQLAYVKDEDQFYTCEADTKTWMTIDLKGEQGEQGPQGIAGSKGDKGDSADPVPANEWFDPIAHKYWLIGAVMTESEINFNSSTACSGDWSMPTKADAITAVQHGLLIASASLHGPAQVWTQEFTQGQGSARIAISASASELAASLTSNAGVICLRSPTL